MHETIRTASDEQNFTESLEKIYNRHTNVVPTMAQGVLLIKQQLPDSSDCPFLLDFLNRFYLSRMGIRILISQHITCHQQAFKPQSGYIGTIATTVKPHTIIEQAVADATRICNREYGNAPDVLIKVENENATIAFVPSHLHHIVFELLKNSMRAVLETHGHNNYDAPAIRIIITDDQAEFGIKVSDQGNGIPRKDLNKIWSYLYTTIKRSPQELQELLSTASSSNAGPVQVMAGFGYGLPIARLYSRYFGGDLEVVSVYGYGTDAYLYLNKLGDNNLLLE
jgi:pyruvate dehydrogenase kinase 2/3/4